MITWRKREQPSSEKRRNNKESKKGKEVGTLRTTKMANQEKP